MRYHVVVGRLETRTALHVGGGVGSEVTDAPIQRDAQGKPVIPGTAIAGALRALLTRLAPRVAGAVCRSMAEQAEERWLPCSCPVCRLLGDINPSDKEGSGSAASRLLVYNARFLGKEVPLTAIRDGVGIERAFGAAAGAGSVKFDLEVVPAGAEFQMRMELRDADEEDERWLAAALAEWEAGRLWIGGRSARGLGAVTLRDVEFRTLRLDEPDELMDYLRSDRPWERAVPVPDWLKQRCGEVRLAVRAGVPDGDRERGNGRGQATGIWVTFTGTLRFEDGCVTNDMVSAVASGFHHAPALDGIADWKRPVLPGSGLRGVLRSHAEKLARTAAYRRAASRGEFLERCPACDPHAKSRDQREPLHLESCDSLLNRRGADPGGSLDALCLACRLFGSPRSGSRLKVEDAPFDERSEPRYKMWDFLAIDRFTGGAVKGLKFDALVLWRPAFRLQVHLDNPQDWELGWLALVFRDAAEGWLSAGYGRAKGFGRMRLTDGKTTFGCLSEGDLPRELRTARMEEGESGFYRIYAMKFPSAEWDRAAGRWVEAFQREIGAFSRRDSKLALERDHCFDRGEDMALAYFEGSGRGSPCGP